MDGKRQMIEIDRYLIDDIQINRKLSDMVLKITLIFLVVISIKALVKVETYFNTQFCNLTQGNRKQLNVPHIRRA